MDSHILYIGQDPYKGGPWVCMLHLTASVRRNSLKTSEQSNNMTKGIGKLIYLQLVGHVKQGKTTIQICLDR